MKAAENMHRTLLQPKYKRQRFLLSFIRQLNETLRATDLQKLVFLYVMKEDLDYYEFIPYKYGAYSFQLAADIDVLRRDGFLLQNTPEIAASANTANLENFLIEKKRGNDLIREAYSQYPYFAINSEILDRLFTKDAADVFRNYKNKYIRTEPVLFTIGYEGRTIENFINTLIQNNVKMLVDVRRNPISRKFGFSRNNLEHITKEIDIKYIHMPLLGVDSEKRAFLKTEDDYMQLFDEYKNSLKLRINELDFLYSLFTEEHRLALVCFEKEAKMCHRHVIRDYLAQTYDTPSIDL